MNTAFLIQLLVNGLVVGTLYGVVAMSFVLIYKATQVVNFAQGELLLIGAWVCWALLAKYQVPFWLGMPMTLVFMFAFGILVQVVILRPLIGEPIISVIMVTIALSAVFQAALKWIYGGKRDIPVDTVIRFQDGTTQRIRTTLRVVDLADGAAIAEAAE